MTIDNPCSACGAATEEGEAFCGRCWDRSADAKDLDALLELAKKLPPMTQEEKDEQAASFVYGNLKISGIEVSRDEVREVVRKVRSGG